MSEWISVKNKLPEEGEKVLTFSESPWCPYKLAVLNGGSKGWYSHETTGIYPVEHVTHWAPLCRPTRG